MQVRYVSAVARGLGCLIPALLFAQVAQAATFTVTNTNASGAGSLLQAVIDSENAAGADTIAFAIPGAGVKVIALTGTGLPQITQRLTIDGWSQGGAAYNGPPLIEMDGAATTNVNGLDIAGSDCVVRGMAIVRFGMSLPAPGQGSGIRLRPTAQRTLIFGNNIGIGADGQSNRGNRNAGILIDAGSENNRIGTNGDGARDPLERNLIGGSLRFSGVWIFSSNNIVAGNHIGVGADGLTAIPNAFDGVAIQDGAANNRIGSDGNSANDAAERNVISGNGSRGVGLSNAGPANRISGNYIGVGADGQTQVANAAAGIASAGSPGVLIGVDGSNDANNAFERNVIAGNGSNGINVSGVASVAVVIAGNYIGVGADGSTAVPNNRTGLVVQTGARQTRVGTNADGVVDAIESNIISGNRDDGIAILTAPTELTQVSGNVIGLAADRTTQVPNQRHGVLVENVDSQTIGSNLDTLRDDVEGNLIVANDAGVRVNDSTRILIGRNTIKSNTENGVEVVGANALGVAILSNSIDVNGLLGIDLGDDGVSPNDSLDADIGPNDLQNFPVITSLTFDGQATATLNSRINMRYVVEFFASASPDISGFGEGEAFLGSNVVMTDGTGAASASLSFTPIAGKPWITATATEVTLTGPLFGTGGSMPPAGTSEFSLAVILPNQPPVAVDDLYATSEDTVLAVAALQGVLNNDVNSISGPLTANLVTTTSNGSLSLNANGSFSYTPSLNFNGQDSFTYRARNTDSQDSNVATVRINVTPLNDLPVAVNDAYSTNEDTALVVGQVPGVLSNDSDPDNDPLTAVLATSTSNGSLVLNANGSFTYTPSLNFNGIDTFTYRASDGQATSNLATVTITVNPVNDPPLAVNDTYVMFANTTLTVNLPGVLANDSDPEGDAIIAMNFSAASVGGLSAMANGGFVYTPPTNFTGNATFTYRAQDTSGANSNTATVTITVNPNLDPPVPANDAYTTNEDTPLIVNAVAGILANDFSPGNLPLTVVSPTTTSNGVLAVNPNGSFMYVPTQNFSGTNTFTYRVSNGSLTSINTATVTITVVSINDPPVARCQDVTIDARVSCPPNFNVTPQQVDNGSDDKDHPTASLTLALSPVGPYPIGVTRVTLTVTDPLGASDSCQANITVLGNDCNGNGIPDACEIFNGTMADCNNDGVPDDCQCFWDNGAASPAADVINGQLSHLGGGIPLGARAADDFYLCEGEVHRVSGFSGQLITDSILLKAKLDLYADCDGQPGELLYTFANSTAVVNSTLPGGFRLVTYSFNLCDQKIWLSGGTYWVSLMGKTDGQGTDKSYWASTERTDILGSVPFKALGVNQGLPFNQYAFGPWESIAECCIGCTDLAFKVTGESCPLVWDNGPPALAGSWVDDSTGIIQNWASGSPSGANGSITSRTFDNFVIKTCEDVEVCFIETYIWTDCSPVNGFVELYDNECRTPGIVPLAGLTANASSAVYQGETTVIDGRVYRLYRLLFCDLDWTLERGTTYWLSTGARPTGSFSERSFFAYSFTCKRPCQIRLSPGERIDIAPVLSQDWIDTGKDFSFLIGARVEQRMIQGPNGNGSSTPTVCPADFNNDGVGDLLDLLGYLDVWLPGCP